MAWGAMPTEILEQIIIHATREKGDVYPPGEYRPEPSYRQFSSKAPFLESPKYKWLVAARNMANVCAHWRRAVLSSRRQMWYNSDHRCTIDFGPGNHSTSRWLYGEGKFLAKRGFFRYASVLGVTRGSQHSFSDDEIVYFLKCYLDEDSPVKKFFFEYLGEDPAHYKVAVDIFAKCKTPGKQLHMEIWKPELLWPIFTRIVQYSPTAIDRIYFDLDHTDAHSWFTVGANCLPCFSGTPVSVNRVTICLNVMFPEKKQPEFSFGPLSDKNFAHFACKLQDFLASLPEPSVADNNE